jgi:capsular polysaccharide biosynthesis protein
VKARTEELISSPRLPPLSPFGELASFDELLPPSQEAPPPPRFIYGIMPPDVAITYFGRHSLPQTGVYSARNITVGAGPCLYHDNDMLVGPEIHLHAANIEEAAARYGLSGRPDAVRKVEGPHALIVGPGYQIYGHWMAEILPKLGLLRSAGLDLDKLRFLLPHDTPAFALEMLRLLGFEENQLEPFGGPFGSVTVSDFFATSFLHNAVRYVGLLKESVDLLRDRVERRFGRLARGENPTRLCVARRGGNRASLSRAMIEAECANAGFRVITPEALPLLDQWRLFADARQIIGEYGSALHGAIFSAAGSVVCGIRGSGFHPAFIQSGMGEQLLQPTGYVFGVNEGDDTGPFHVNQRDLTACLQQMFGAARVT